jgi:hypothetical protein
MLSIDEACLLFENDFQPTAMSGPEGPNIMYYSIGRMSRCLRYLTFFRITLLTKSNITDMMATATLDPSARVMLFDMKHATPFTAFPMSIVMSNNIRLSKMSELKKSLADFQLLHHVNCKSMGRMLWDVFDSRH